MKYVRGGTGSYGKNSFSDNQDGTVADAATGLVWDQDDSGKGLDWQEALAWVQAKNAASYKGHADWRLPNAKELQSIVDYARSTTRSAALDPLFSASTITDEAGDADYPWYWTGTTHQALNSSYSYTGETAVYIAFGKALGYFGIDSLNGSSTGGPTSCTVQADCDAAGACPSALGCTCAAGPSGKACIPKCIASKDCPQPPGMTLVCGPDNLCVPG